MKFESVTQFADYLIKNNITMSDLDIELTDEKKDELLESCTITVDDTDEDVLVESVKISSLGNNPSIKFEIANIPINELHVKNFDILKDACGTGNITLSESTVFLNICNMEDKTTTKMSITVNGNKYNNMELSLKESSEEKLILSREWVDNNIGQEISL